MYGKIGLTNTDDAGLRDYFDNQINNVENSIIKDYSFSSFPITDLFKNGFELTNGYKSVKLDF